MAGNKPFNKQQTDARERDPQVAGLKVPPHSIEAEQSVLGGLMLDNERWDDVAERVVTDDFYTRPHRHIFTEMARLGDRVDGQRPLAVIHAKDENSWQEAAKAVKAAIKLDDKAPEITPTVYRRITE